MLGIICGLEAEASLARRLKGAVVACSAADPKKAREQSLHLIEQGATSLMSFGLAGALSPELKAGDLILPSCIISEKGNWLCDHKLLSKLRTCLSQAEASSPRRRGSHLIQQEMNLWGSEILISNPSEKKKIFETKKCDATDMESHAVAEIASSKAIPFVVLRAITDTYDMELPPAAQIPLLDDGRIDGFKIAKSIIRETGQIPALIHLGLNTAKAKSNLLKVINQMNAANLSF